jgi:hypothetical protein
MQTGILEAPSQQQQSLAASSQAVRSNSVSFLDSSIPLQDASHGEVVTYTVETIWRKAECIATLTDGRKAKLRDAWQFIGYTGKNSARRLLFRNNGLHIEVQIDSNQLQVALEQKPARDLFAAIKERLATLLSANSNSLIRVLNRSRVYTAVDGSQVSLAGCHS